VAIDSSLDLRSAIVGQRITAHSSARIHYDRALGDGDGTLGIVTERLDWRVLTTSQR
jgi:hypothetical protein